MFPKALRKAAGSKIPILTTVQLRRASERNAQNLLIENITEKQSNIPKPESKAINNGAQHKVSLKKYNESEKKKTVSVFERLYQQAKKVAPVEAITKRDTTKDLQKSDVPNRPPRKVHSFFVVLYCTHFHLLLRRLLSPKQIRRSLRTRFILFCVFIQSENSYHILFVAHIKRTGVGTFACISSRKAEEEHAVTYRFKRDEKIQKSSVQACTSEW